MKSDQNNLETLKTYNKMAKDYVRINYQTEFWIDEFNIFKKLLLGKKILDIGCGAGRDAILFTIRGYDYLGIDDSSGMLRVARLKAPKAKFKKANFYSLDEFRNFDGFWAAASLLHAPKNKIVPILKSIRNTITDNGVGFIALRLKTDKIDEQIVPNKKYNSATRFFAYYTKSEFKKLLEKSGFRVLKMTEKLELPDNKIWLCFFVKKKSK